MRMLTFIIIFLSNIPGGVVVDPTTCRKYNMKTSTSRMDGKEESGTAATRPVVVTSVTSSYVQATGCHSNNRTTNNQDVHVLVLDGRASTSSVVKINITTLSSPVSNRKKMKMVMGLFSSEAITWIISKDMNLKRVIFMVSNGSSVVQEDDSGKRSKVRVKMRKSKRSWLRFVRAITKKYKALTSLTRIQQRVSMIHFNHPGSKNKKCDVMNIKESNVVQAVFHRKKTVSSCFQHLPLQRNPSRSELHVLLMNNSADNLDEVAVSLSSATTYLHKRNIVLLLQSTKPIIWVITSHSLHGLLQIMSDSPVKMKTFDGELVVVAKQEVMPRNLNSLMNVALMLNATLASFSQVQQANKIEVTFTSHNFVSDAVRSQKLEETASTINKPMHPSGIQKRERSPFFNLVESSKNLETSTTSLLTPSITQNLGRNMPKEHLQEQIHRLRVVQDSPEVQGSILVQSESLSAADIGLMRIMRVQCRPTSMVVSFVREIIEALVPDLSQLTLADTQCTSAVNATHHSVVSAQLQQCGSEILYQNKYIVVQNYVNFNVKKRERFRLAAANDVPKPVYFQCRYQLDNDDEFGSSSKVKFAIQLFKDSKYEKEMQGVAYPLDIEEEKTIYVHISADIEVPFLGILLNQCWLSTTNHQVFNNNSNDMLLIKNRCPVDEHCSYIQKNSETAQPSQRFSFNINKRYIDSFLFLHCNFSLCHQETHPRLLQCMDVMNDCKSQNIQPTQNKYIVLTHKSAGPLRILGQKIPEVVDDDNSDNPAWVNDVIEIAETKSNQDMAKEELEEVDEEKSPRRQRIVLVGLATEAIVGIAFASFIIGTIFMGILWCIYVRTEPRRQRHHNGSNVNVPMQTSGYDLCPQTAVHSGSSTPNSQTPMSA